MNITKIIKTVTLTLLIAMVMVCLESCSSKECEHTELTELSDTATCELDGVKEYRCNQCGKKVEKESIKKGHVYKNGICSRCQKSWKESFNDEISYIKNVSFSYDSTVNGIKWSHSEKYVDANGYIRLEDVNGKIGQMTISAYGSSCTYDVFLSITSDTCNISLKHVSGNEMTMAMLFSNYTSSRMKCSDALANAVKELNEQLKNKFDFKLS